MGKSAGHCRALFRKATTKNIELLFKFMITWRWQVLWNAVCFALQENCFSSLLFQTLQQWCLLQSPQGNPPFKAGVFYYRKCKKKTLCKDFPPRHKTELLSAGWTSGYRWNLRLRAVQHLHTYCSLYVNCCELGWNVLHHPALKRIRHWQMLLTSLIYWYGYPKR